MLAGLISSEELKADGSQYDLSTPYHIPGPQMGKTEKGTVWLDQALTLPYDYYQYWVNVD